MTTTRLIALALLTISACATRLPSEQVDGPAIKASPCGGSGIHWKCRMDVRLKDGKLVLTDPFVVKPHGERQEVEAIWILKDNDLHFASGDGIFFMKSNNQVKFTCRADARDACVGEDSKAPRFIVKFHNTEGFSLPYCVRLHRGNQVLEFDPTIANSFGTNRDDVLINQSPCRP